MGDVVVIMDDDLQHHSSDIAALEAGFNVVCARFEQKQQAACKKLGSWFNDRIVVLRLGKPNSIYMSPYKAIRREVVQEIIKYAYPYVDSPIFAVTSKITQVPATRHTRFCRDEQLQSFGIGQGISHCRRIFCLSFANGGISGWCHVAVGIPPCCLFVVDTLIWSRGPEVWASVIVAILFIGGVQLIGPGAVGEYVGRIFVTQSAFGTNQE